VHVGEPLRLHGGGRRTLTPFNPEYGGLGREEITVCQYILYLKPPEVIVIATIVLIL
jgi:hypothetical protein